MAQNRIANIVKRQFTNALKQYPELKATITLTTSDFELDYTTGKPAGNTQTTETIEAIKGKPRIYPHPTENNIQINATLFKIIPTDASKKLKSGDTIDIDGEKWRIINNQGSVGNFVADITAEKVG